MLPPNGSNRFQCIIFSAWMTIKIVHPVHKDRSTEQQGPQGLLVPLQLGQSWKLATLYMVAHQHDIWYFPNGPGSYVYPERSSSWEELNHPLLIGCILLYDHSFAYAICFPSLWQFGQFHMPTLVSMKLLHEFSACSGIHVCSLSTEGQINWKSGFLPIHQIVWTEPCNCISSAIIFMH